MRRSLLLLVALFAFSALAAPRPYHLELEANAAAPFPFLGKLGTMTLHVYAGGVRAETLWLSGFSRTGTPSVTVMNPLTRMYSEMPLSGVADQAATLSLGELKNMSAILATPVNGRVKELPATRYRLIFGPTAYIDVWSTHAVPENPQYRALVQQFVTGLAPQIGALAKTIPGTPVYVELNFRRYPKLALLRLKSFAFDDNGEADALSVGSFYLHVPSFESLRK
jgi:hypothetical protein